MKISLVAILTTVLCCSAAELRGTRRNLVGQVTKLRLINADTDAVITDLPNGKVVNFGGTNLNVEAVTSGSVGSVKFAFDQNANHRTESAAPYALCGDSGGNFFNCPGLTSGSHTVSATTYSGGGASGEAGSTVTINFSIVVGSTPTTPAPVIAPTTPAPVIAPTTPAPVTAPTTPAPVATPAPAPVPTSGISSLKLIYAPTNTEVMDLNNGDEVQLSSLGLESDELNVKAVTVGSVDNVIFSNGRNEGVAPYAYCGDAGGNFYACDDMKVGNSISITATPYKQGSALANYTVWFSIAAGPPTPTASPTTPQPVTTPPPGSDWAVVNTNAPIEARHEACFVMVGRRAYLVGGRGNKRTDIYDIDTQTWSVGATCPQQIHHMQCVAAGGKLYVLGAWTDWYPKENNAKQWVYDPEKNLWSDLAPMLDGRERGSAAVIVSADEKKIYVSHGNKGGHETETGDLAFAVSLGYLDEYDIQTNTWKALSSNAPNPRDHAGGALVNGRICVAGGRNGGEQGWPSVAPTDCYNLSTGTWSVEAPIPNPRGGSAYGQSCDGKLIIAGGEGGGKAWDNVDVFDGKSWSSLPSLNQARHGTGLAIACSNNRQEIHIASGAENQGGGPETKHHERFVIDL